MLIKVFLLFDALVLIHFSSVFSAEEQLENLNNEIANNKNKLRDMNDDYYPSKDNVDGPTVRILMLFSLR